MSDLRSGQLVTGVVVAHRHFGVVVDIGEAEHAVAVITMLEDDPRSRDPVMPPVGDTVEGVFLGHSGPGHQPRLSMRPGDVEKARASG